MLQIVIEYDQLLINSYCVKVFYKISLDFYSLLRASTSLFDELLSCLVGNFILKMGGWGGTSYGTNKGVHVDLLLFGVLFGLIWSLYTFYFILAGHLLY